MNKMSKKLKLILTGMAFTAAVFQMQAIPLLVGEGHTGDNSPATTFAFAQGLLTSYNTANNPDLPGLPTPPSFDVTTGYPRFDTPSGPTDDIPIDITGSFGYVIFKWGGADKNPHEVQLYYFDAPGNYLFDAPTYLDGTKTKQNGLSHYDLFQGRSTSVPDSGGTLALLGAALGSIGMIRRKLSAR